MEEKKFKIGDEVEFKRCHCVIVDYDNNWYTIKFDDGNIIGVQERDLQKFGVCEYKVTPKFAVEDIVFCTLYNKVGVITEIKDDNQYGDILYKIDVINNDMYFWVSESQLLNYSPKPTWDDFKDMTDWTDSIKVPIYCNAWFKYWSAYFKLFTVAKILNDGWTKNYSNKGWKLTYMQAVEVGEYNCDAGTIYFKTREIAYKAKSVLTDEEFESLFKCV